MLALDGLKYVGLNHYLVLSGILFTMGMIAVMMRRNVIVILMGVELMLNAVNLSFVAFSHFRDNLHGQLMVFFVMTVAAAEAGVGLALAVTVYRRFREVNIRSFEQLKG